MSKLIYFSLLFSLISCSITKDKYFDSDYQNILKLAAKQDKMIFIDFYTVWCGPCQFFDKNIKHDSVFKSYMTDNFFTLQIDAELEQNKDIVSKFRINGYPTFIIANSKGEERDRIGGLTEKSPEKFIFLIKSILKGKEELDSLKQLYIQYPDSIELFRKVVIDKLLDRQMFSSVIDLSDFAISKSKDSSLVQLAKFSKAYASIKDPKTQSPKLMFDFVGETVNEQMVEYGYNELFNYYRSKNKIDSTKICLNKLVTFRSGNHLAYVRDYAKFLYEHDTDIEYANKLTKEYTDSPGSNSDHWTPYLNAHRLAKQGKLSKGIENFDNWMAKYSIPENFKEDYWHYQFYIDFMIFYQVASTKAIKYAEKFEVDNPNIDNKQQLAELYYLNGQNDNAINKIKEIQAKIEDPKKEEKYNNLIDKYTDSQ